jgi:hypothetical protein
VPADEPLETVAEIDERLDIVELSGFGEQGADHPGATTAVGACKERVTPATGSTGTPRRPARSAPRPRRPRALPYGLETGAISAAAQLDTKVNRHASAHYGRIFAEPLPADSLGSKSSA